MGGSEEGQTEAAENREGEGRRRNKEERRREEKGV